MPENECNIIAALSNVLELQKETACLKFNSPLDVLGLEADVIYPSDFPH